MKTITFRLICLTIFCVVASPLEGCVSSSSQAVNPVRADTVKIRWVPKPEILADSGKARQIPAGFLKRRLRLGYPSLKNIIINDRQYVYITDNWFDEIIRWTEDFITLQAPSVDITREMPLDYPAVVSALAVNAANLTVAKMHNLKASVLIGVMAATSSIPWGGIPADGKIREYVIALTAQGGIVYDLQTRQRISFEQFPNRDHMLAISF